LIPGDSDGQEPHSFDAESERALENEAAGRMNVDTGTHLAA